MGSFVCRSCSTQSDQAARCPACGARSFGLSEEARMAADVVTGRSGERRGQLVPITDAPSLRRRRRTAAG